MCLKCAGFGSEGAETAVSGLGRAVVQVGSELGGWIPALALLSATPVNLHS